MAIAETLRSPSYPRRFSDYRMTTWERLEKYGSIKNFRRKDDPQIYNAYLVAGKVKVVRDRRCKTIIEVYPKEYYLTLDSFLWLFLENLPCDYPQYRGQ